MKKRIFSILFAVVLVLTLGLVTAAPVAAAVINVPADQPTIQAAVNAANPGDTIIVAPGIYAGATVTKAVIIKGQAVAVINTGPFYKPTGPRWRAGFLFPGGGVGSGTTISGFTFQGQVQPVRSTDDGWLDLPIYSHGANSVTIKNNVMTNSLQAISNWHGSGWHIRNNTVNVLWVQNAGGIGIFIGSRFGTAANDNFVGFNRITAHIVADSIGYSTPGICLMSDARWSFSGGPVQDNKVLHNDVTVTATYQGNPSPTGEGIELTDFGWYYQTIPSPIVVDNKVVQNDPSGSATPLAFYPIPLKNYNVIHNNPGKGRGHGLPPAPIY